MTLTVGAVVQERLDAYAKLKDINQNLELKVQERTHEIQQTLEQVKAMQEQIITQEKLASLGELTAGIAHEIKNPLNFVNNFANLTVKQSNKLVEYFEKNKERLSPEESSMLKKTLDTLVLDANKIVHYGQRADSIVKNMLSHAHTETITEFQLTDLNALIKEIVKLTYSAKQLKDPTFNVIFDNTYDPEIKKIDLIPNEFRRVIQNVLDNALFAVNKKRGNSNYSPKISITTKNQDDNHVTIKIRDNGIGIPPAIMEKVFNPFFTTKPPGEGTGLGLSLSRDVVVGAHHGEIKINSEEGNFTEFLIVIPKNLSSSFF
jgi:signal transduction histidine kinase